MNKDNEPQFLSVKTQEEVFDEVVEEFKLVFPDLLHGSGGLPDTKGPGTSDVDICLYSKEYNKLAKNFPPDTVIEHGDGWSTYSLKGFDRGVEIYASNKDGWDNGFKHRAIELMLNQFPNLRIIAWTLKRITGKSTEETWAKVLDLDQESFYKQEFEIEEIEKAAKKKEEESIKISKVLAIK